MHFHHNRRSKFAGFILSVSLFSLGWSLGDGSQVNAANLSLPEVDRLPVIEGLPELLMFQDGTRVTNPSDWLRRRAEICQQVQYYEYGHLPPAPGNVVAEKISSHSILDGAATEQRLILSMGPGQQIHFHLRMLVPQSANSTPRQLPVIVLNANDQNGHSPIDRELIERGYALAIYNRTDLAPDRDSDRRPGHAPEQKTNPHQLSGSARRAYPQYDWATLAIWAWGGMRALDYLETLAWVNPKKVVITGHSRGGKVALLAGALDERFALVVPNGSGCGGTGCFRVLGAGSESLEAITEPGRFGYWFHPRLRTFAGQVERLPLDQHFLRALVAPRGLLSTDALADAWGNPLGTQVTYQAAQPVFDLFEVPNHQGQHFRRGTHDHLAEDWRALLDFADRLFFEQPTQRNFKRTPFEVAR